MSQLPLPRFRTPENGDRRPEEGKPEEDREGGLDGAPVQRGKKNVKPQFIRVVNDLPRCKGTHSSGLPSSGLRSALKT